MLATAGPQYVSPPSPGPLPAPKPHPSVISTKLPAAVPLGQIRGNLNLFPIPVMKERSISHPDFQTQVPFAFFLVKKTNGFSQYSCQISWHSFFFLRQP